MQFVRQRTLSAVDPVTTTVATIALGAAGAGYWSLVMGAVVGSAAGALAAVATSPYRLRLRFERHTARSYADFSWPLLGFQVSNIVVTQGLLLVVARSAGVAGVGAIALATVIASFADRVDAIVSETLYPAVCAVAERTELMFEVFLTSNRLALMWGTPFGVGLALFASDLVHFGIGDEWEQAIGLLAAFGLMAAVKQVGFNWQIFMRAANLTRPIFFAALVNVASFFAIVVPLVLTMGLTGFALGSAAGVVLQLVARTYFLRRLFPRFSPLRQFLRAIAPTIPPAALVLLVRLVAGQETSLAAGLALLALYVTATIAVTWYLERRLVSEMLGYLRGGGGGIRTQAQQAAGPRPEASPNA
jgi:O-antigen/teichoic acid export membrane protein